MAKRLKADDRRNQILDAAVRCFAKNGYRGATTAQLARAARVTEPVLYRHFKNKQSLFIALLDMAAEEAMRLFLTVIGPIKSPVERLRALLRLNPAITDPRAVELYTVVFHAQTEGDPDVQAALRLHYVRYAEFLAGLIQQAQQADQIRRDVSAIGLSWQIIHAAVGFAMIKPLQIPGQATREAIEQIMALLMEQLSGGPHGDDA
jgi:AcrR family transcriptional regulator